MVGRRTLLIANRGEIAMRITRTARALGYRTVAIYSDADRDAPHVYAAHQAVRVGAASPSASYLNIEAIVEAAGRTGATMVHPGYGFLSESAAFARRCREAGFVFVGPPTDAIAQMGDKVGAKKRMRESGVPCLPGTEEDLGDEALEEATGDIGFPVMLKAAAGGGGRGMRVVRSAESLMEALASARREAEQAFGDGRLLLERYVEGGRHVEVQVLADQRGNVIHLGERECSVQRRHQKIIEEAPCPSLPARTRVRMTDAAVRAAEAIGYVGAGTVEFLLEGAEDFYFLEMNTRLQVEHAVTEMVTGIDLVACQLEIADGLPLTVAQSDIAIAGHAIEARLYAEDPSRGFLPQSGRVAQWRPPLGTGIRVDCALASGYAVPPDYDSMVAKVVAHGPSREVARQRLIAALQETVLLGPMTNREFLFDLLASEPFARAEIRTDRIDGQAPAPWAPPSSAMWAMAALVCSGVEAPRTAWSNRGERRWWVELSCEEERRRIVVHAHGEGYARMLVDGVEVRLQPIVLEGGCLRVHVDGIMESVWVVQIGHEVYVQCGAHAARFVEVQACARSRSDSGTEEQGLLTSPLTGRVRSIEVGPGAAVERGDRLLVLEAMKMEHAIRASSGGVIRSVRARVGEHVTRGQLLIEVDVHD